MSRRSAHLSAMLDYLAGKGIPVPVDDLIAIGSPHISSAQAARVGVRLRQARAASGGYETSPEINWYSDPQTGARQICNVSLWHAKNRGLIHIERVDGKRMAVVASKSVAVIA